MNAVTNQIQTYQKNQFLAGWPGVVAPSEDLDAEVTLDQSKVTISHRRELFNWLAHKQASMTAAPENTYRFSQHLFNCKIINLDEKHLLDHLATHHEGTDSILNKIQNEQACCHSYRKNAQLTHLAQVFTTLDAVNQMKRSSIST